MTNVITVTILDVCLGAMSVLINHQVFGALLGAPRLDVCTLQVQGLTRFCLQLALLDEQSKGIKDSFHQEEKMFKLIFLSFYFLLEWKLRSKDG